ncbi:Uncharacterized protein SCF082_LOCUS50574, partial [Durusdinium trenchii]
AMSIYDSDNTLFVFCVTEDAGSDQKAQRLKLLTMLSAGLEDSEDPYQNVLFWDVNCLVHQFNLVVALDEYREYQVKMSKYMQSAVHAAQSATFWFFVHVSQASKEPLIECFAWLQKTKQSAIIKLVTEKAFEFSEKLRKLVTDRRWIVYCLEESGAKKTLPPDRQAQLINAASRIAAHNATAFERRIVEYITGFLN